MIRLCFDKNRRLPRPTKDNCNKTQENQHITVASFRTFSSFFCIKVNPNSCIRPADGYDTYDT